ncbi:MAG: 4-hydroxythreonine-4-phosphate dehydrogenase PdxA [Terriglobia bacterium]
MKPVLGITMGDAAGIGPEIILKSFQKHKELFDLCRPLVIGSAAVMDFYNRRLGIGMPMRVISSPQEAAFESGILDILDLGMIDVSSLRISVVEAEVGRAAVVYTQEAGKMAMAGSIDAIVSAPLNKEAMRAAGYLYEGQTQILGELTRSERYGMILIFGRLRVMMLTTHVALRKACDAVTRNKVLAMIELSHQTLKTLGIPQPRIAVAGLNPHSGEGGLFGREELEGSIPAIEAARALGIDAVGPVPADVVFLKARDGEYDLVLAMYHDQANMASKLLGFGEVVTLLAGLPLVRTSVGHGTAFDIAGQGIANETNLVCAIQAAAEFATLRRKATP